MAKNLKKVLIVDDEETLTWSLAKSLSKDKDKYEVIIANNGREALAKLEKNKIDLVITDIRMPDINGLDLMVKIKKEYPQTKVIIMTAYGSSDIQKEANQRGSLYYVEKPFEISDIRKIIIDLIGKKKRISRSNVWSSTDRYYSNELPWSINDSTDYYKRWGKGDHLC
jgi:DNA-binding NtrC family response regulator